MDGKIAAPAFARKRNRGRHPQCSLALARLALPGDGITISIAGADVGGERPPPQRRLPISYHAAPFLLAIGPRCEASFDSETAVKVAEVLETRHQRNFGDCIRGGLKQRGSTPHAKPENPLRGYAHGVTFSV